MLECIWCAILYTTWITTAPCAKFHPTPYLASFSQDSTLPGLFRNASENSLLISVSNWQMEYRENGVVFVI